MDDRISTESNATKLLQQHQYQSKNIQNIDLECLYNIFIVNLRLGNIGIQLSIIRNKYFKLKNTRSRF